MAPFGPPCLCPRTPRPQVLGLLRSAEDPWGTCWLLPSSWRFSWAHGHWHEDSVSGCPGPRCGRGLSLAKAGPAGGLWVWQSPGTCSSDPWAITSAGPSLSLLPSCGLKHWLPRGTWEAWSAHVSREGLLGEDRPSSQETAPCWQVTDTPQAGATLSSRNSDCYEDSFPESLKLSPTWRRMADRNPAHQPSRRAMTQDSDKSSPLQPGRPSPCSASASRQEPLTFSGRGPGAECLSLLGPQGPADDDITLPG